MGVLARSEIRLIASATFTWLLSPYKLRSVLTQKYSVFSRARTTLDQLGLFTVQRHGFERWHACIEI